MYFTEYDICQYGCAWGHVKQWKTTKVKTKIPESSFLLYIQFFLLRFNKSLLFLFCPIILSDCNLYLIYRLTENTSIFYLCVASQVHWINTQWHFIWSSWKEKVFFTKPRFWKTLKCEYKKLLSIRREFLAKSVHAIPTRLKKI